MNSFCTINTLSHVQCSDLAVIITGDRVFALLLIAFCKSSDSMCKQSLSFVEKINNSTVLKRLENSLLFHMDKLEESRKPTFSVRATVSGQKL